MTTSRVGITTDQLFENALASREPLWELRSVVRGLLADGHDRERVLDDLDRFRDGLRATGRDQDEDTVLDVMDFVVGWCSPHVRL